MIYDASKNDYTEKFNRIYIIYDVEIEAGIFSFILLVMDYLLIKIEV